MAINPVIIVAVIIFNVSSFPPFIRDIMSTTTIEIIIVDGIKESQFVKKTGMHLFARIINGKARSDTVIQAHNKTIITML